MEQLQKEGPLYTSICKAYVITRPDLSEFGGDCLYLYIADVTALLELHTSWPSPVKAAQPNCG